MQNDEILQLTQFLVFKNFSPSELAQALQARTSHHGAGAVIVREGDEVDRLGFILQGRVRVQRTNHAGHTHLIAQLVAGDLLGEVFVVAGLPHSMVAVCAEVECRLLWLCYEPRLAAPTALRPLILRFQLSIAQNIAQKALKLQDKLFVLSQTSLPSKTLTLLALHAPTQQWFTLPLSRQEMADYLCVNRSALSRALSQMKDSGALDFKGSRFWVGRK